MTEYRLPFPPVGCNRGKSVRQREYAESIHRAMADETRPPVQSDVIARMIFNPPMPTGYRRFIKYDLDNLLKPVFDALKGIAYVDDNQVRCVHAAFGHRSGDGSVYVTIEPLIRKTVVYEKETRNEAL